MNSVFRFVVFVVIGCLLTACGGRTDKLSIGSNPSVEISSRDGVRYFEFAVPEWATEITIQPKMEYGNIVFAVSSKGKMSKPFDEAVSDCVGNVSSFEDEASLLCVIPNPKGGVWGISVYGLDPENKFFLSISGEMDWLWKYEVIGASESIIRDNVTGLEWQRCSVGEAWDINAQECTGTAIKVYGDDSLNYAAAGGFRLPTAEELHSLVYCHTGEPEYFPGTDKSCLVKTSSRLFIVEEFFPINAGRFGYKSDFWSSSRNVNPELNCTGSDQSNCLKNVYFLTGNISSSNSNWGAYEKKVRLVRGIP